MGAIIIGAFVRRVSLWGCQQITYVIDCTEIILTHAVEMPDNHLIAVVQYAEGPLTVSMQMCIFQQIIAASLGTKS